MQAEREIERVAARQHGVFSRAQAMEAGLSVKMIETRLTSGAWLRMATSVYAIAAVPPNWERQVSAALLSRPGAVAAGSTAAYLQSFDGIRQGRPVVMTAMTGNSRSPIARVIRSRVFDDVAQEIVRGFPTTTIPETLVTLAATTSAPRIESILDSLLGANRLEIDDLLDVIDRRRGFPGIVMLRELAAERSSQAYQPPMSELERLLFRVLDHNRVPSVVRQMPFAFESVDMTVDAYIPRWRLIVEADGRRWHIRVADFERDRRRDNEAVAHGYAVLRFTYRMLTREPEWCFETLLSTGSARTAT